MRTLVSISLLFFSLAAYAQLDVERLTVRAEDGHVTSQYILGRLYSTGRGATQDDAKAVKWYRLAAEQGYDMAQYDLGLLYRSGKGVPQSDAEAVNWFQLAAEQGQTLAQDDLGSMYESGRGVPQNDVEAVKWFRLAAEQGYVIAQFNLGRMYSLGRGLQYNEAEAVKWYRLAAEQGFPRAQYNLAIKYLNGEGVTLSNVFAHYWSSKAAAQGHEQARRMRDAISAKTEVAKYTDVQPEQLFIEIEYDDLSVVINEPFTLYLKLYYTIDGIRNPTFSTLEFSDDVADVMPVENVQYEEERNGIRYGVYRKEYEITPFTDKPIIYPHTMFRGELGDGDSDPVQYIFANSAGFEISARSD